MKASLQRFILITTSCVWFLVGGEVLAPLYNGRAIGSWLDDLVASDTIARDHATRTLREAGTNVLPFLIQELRTVATNHSNWTDTDVQGRIARLRAGFRVLGPLAKSAVPEIVHELETGDNPCTAAFALAQIGPENLVHIRRALTNQTITVRQCAVSYVVLFKDASGIEDCIPPLIDCLTSDSAVLRSLTAQSLGVLKRSSPVVVPALMARLAEDPEFAVRANAVNALARFGDEARLALALLNRISESPSENVTLRKLAGNAYKTIQAKSN